MRRFLDRLYLAAGWLAAGCILFIAVLVSAQVMLNLATRIFALPLPSAIPSYADFSGFLLAAASFLAAPWTLRSGGHIRVSLVISRLPDGIRHYVELATLAIAGCLVGYACFYIIVLVGESWQFNDLSPGIIPVPLWIPQSIMGVGMGLLLVSLIDAFVTTLWRGTSFIQHTEEM